MSSLASSTTHLTTPTPSVQSDSSGPHEGSFMPPSTTTVGGLFPHVESSPSSEKIRGSSPRAEDQQQSQSTTTSNVSHFNLDSDDSSSDSEDNSPDDDEHHLSPPSNGGGGAIPIAPTSPSIRQSSPHPCPYIAHRTTATSLMSSPTITPPETIPPTLTASDPQSDPDSSGSTATTTSTTTSASSVTTFSMQSTMWLGTEDGCIHVYNCNNNIRVKKNKIKIQLSSTVNSIAFLDNRVFAGLSNGQLVMFTRNEESGFWRTHDPHLIELSSSPVSKILPVGQKLWCAVQNHIKIFNPSTMEVELSFHVSVDVSRIIHCMVASGLGVWVSTQSSPIIRLYHATTYECLLDVNVAPAVSKILSSEFLPLFRNIRREKTCFPRIEEILVVVEYFSLPPFLPLRTVDCQHRM